VEQQRDYTCLALLFSGQRAKRTVAYATNAYVPLLHATPAHQLNSGGNRKGLGTEDWGLATRAREPGTDKLTD